MDSGYYAAMTGLVAQNPGTRYGSRQSCQRSDAGIPGGAGVLPVRAARARTPPARSWAGRSTTTAFLAATSSAWPRAPWYRPAIPSISPFEGEGFFQIQTANGLRYTRDGSFHRSSERPTGHFGRGARAFLGGQDHCGASRGGFGWRRRRAVGRRRNGGDRWRLHVSGRTHS